MVGEFVALLRTVTAPVTLPAAAGVNEIFNTIDWVGVRTVPGAIPLAANPAPVTVTPEIVTFEFPLFTSVELSELLMPMVTFPKLKLVGLALSR
jgi:hypothetical protein